MAPTTIVNRLSDSVQRRATQVPLWPQCELVCSLGVLSLRLLTRRRKSTTKLLTFTIRVISIVFAVYPVSAKWLS